MTTNTNLGGLRQDVREWSQRRNIPDATIDKFIEIALSRACRFLRIPPLEAVSSAIPNENGYIQLPEDFQEVKEISTSYNNQRVILDRKHISEVDYIAGKNSMANCPPEIFGRFGNSLRVAPWGGQDASVNLYYYRVDLPLTDDTSTNWFTLYAPEVLLYGALTELSNYSVDAESSELWNAKFTNEINTLQGVEDRAEWRGSTVGITLPGSTNRRDI